MYALAKKFTSHVILRRYLYQEFVRSFFAVFFLLLLIFISSRFVSYLSDAVAGKLASDQVLAMLGLKLTTSMTLLLPLCLYLAILLVIGRMRREYETTAMANAGLGPGFFRGVAIRLGLWFSLITAALTFVAVPWAEGQISILKAEAAEKSDVIGLTAGRFKEFSKGDRVMYVEALTDDRAEMSGVFLQVRQEGNLAVLTSDAAHLETNEKTDDRFIVFTQGKRYLGTPGQLDFAITEYGKYGVRIATGDVGPTRETLESVSSYSLWQQDRSDYQAELQWRLSMPISIVLLAVLAMQLAFSGNASERYLSVIVAIVIYFTYSNLLGIARSLVKKQEISPWLGLWWVHVLIILLIVIFANYPVLVRYWRSRKTTQFLLGKKAE